MERTLRGIRTGLFVTWFSGLAATLCQPPALEPVPVMAFLSRVAAAVCQPPALAGGLEFGRFVGLGIQADQGYVPDFAFQVFVPNC